MNKGGKPSVIRGLIINHRIYLFKNPLQEGTTPPVYNPYQKLYVTQSYILLEPCACSVLKEFPKAKASVAR